MSWLVSSAAKSPQIPTLLTALQYGMPKAYNLEELWQAVQSYAEQKQKENSELTYNEHLSPRLGQARFGTRKP